MPIINNKWINLIGGTSLGVYFSHQGLSTLFWKKVLITRYATSLEAIIQMISSVTIIFIACVIIDIFRKKLFEKKIMMMMKSSYKLNNINRFMNRLE